MNTKKIKRSLQDIHQKFLASIDNDDIRQIINKKTFITGGSIISLLQNEEPNDYDYYFIDKESCQKVAQYFVDKFNKKTKDSHNVQVQDMEDRIRIYAPHAGIAKAKYEKGFKPVFLSTNAISLSDNIQLITRFYGDPGEIHENYDFVHCTCYYVPSKNELVLPQKALESLITKELRYVGSKYPLASIIRARKFIQRGWNINAGQYLKMILQCGQLDLDDPMVLDEQLAGVDLHLFAAVISVIRQKLEHEPEFQFSIEWVSEVIDTVFDEEDMIEYIHSDDEGNEES